MYRYEQIDKTIVHERVAQFRDQVARRLAGEISELQFKPLRLQNGLYLQLHAYMLRVAIPYGLLSSVQLRRLGDIARRYDRGYGHFSTRQNIQYNWPKLSEVPDLLHELAQVEMHAIQTSGNCVRNVTSDHLAGVARDEIADPRPTCELIRQWSTFHPEFAHLPRKFKIAVTGAPQNDRAAIRFHDIGVALKKNAQGEVGYEVFAGGGMGRTPRVAPSIRSYLEREDLLSYLEAILRVYNLYGRRDNKYKARIKILVEELGTEKFTELVEAEWKLNRDTAIKLSDAEFQRVEAYFVDPDFKDLPNSDSQLAGFRLGKDRALGRWAVANVREHKKPGYSAVFVSLKSPRRPPGDITDSEMEAVADLADLYSFGEIVATHEQNLVLPHVETAKLPELFAKLHALDLAEPNMGRVTDIICCPGLDYCSLANARSIPIATRIQESLEDLDFVHDLGELTLNMSGCINACGHHHVGNIGLLGINKQGEEFYQITLGGAAGTDASIGKILGPAFPSEKIVDAVGKVLQVYVNERESADEPFLAYYRRVGEKPFKERLYANA
jgi:sulfite reductase (NADPH) hemoprotein beta-component